jgi:hypothetical protein
LNELTAVAIVAVIAGAGLGLSMLGHRLDNSTERSPLRCLAGMVGGLAFFAQVEWLDAWTAVSVSGVLTLLVSAVRIGKGLPHEASGRPEQSWAEVTFALSGTASLAVGWGMLGNEWLAFVPIAFMAWGDNVAGLARSTVWKDDPASPLPSFCMFAVCLATSLLFHPWFIGAGAGLLVTLAERYRPRLIGWCDDNPVIVGSSLGTMALLAGLLT